MGSPRTAVFISHVNGDPDAETVVQALVQGLKQQLGPTHDAYEIVYDREIIAGKEWRREIYEWLHDCAAAIILVSKQAFDADKPWVSHEAFSLTVYRNSLRPDLCIIPVCLKGTEKLLKEKKTFDPSDLMRFQALLYPSTPRLYTVEQLVSVIADRLRTELPERDTDPLLGLAAALHKKLAGFPQAALRAAALRLDPVANWSTDEAGLAKQLAKKFLEAGEIEMLQAFCELCEEVRHKKYRELKQELALVLGAQRLREEYAVPIAVEAALPTSAGCSRALLLDSTDRSIIDLYLTRAARHSPHRWEVLNVEPVLEFGQKEDLKKSVRNIIAGKLGLGAGPKEDDRLKLAKNTIPKLRKAGTPVLLSLDYQDNADPGSCFLTIREVSPDLMVLYTASHEAAPEVAPYVPICRLSGAQDHDDLSGTLGALQLYIRRTTPDDDAPAS